MRVGLSGWLVEALALGRWLLVIARHGPSSVLLARLSDSLSDHTLRVSRSWCSLRGGSGGAQVGKLAVSQLRSHSLHISQEPTRAAPMAKTVLVTGQLSFPPTSGALLLRADALLGRFFSLITPSSTPLQAQAGSSPAT